MRTVLSLLLVIGSVFAFQGCGSDSSGDFKKTDGGTCNPAFCPGDTKGVACCLGGVCGVDYGQGCVSKLNDGG